jgi:hypothetical protein
MKNKLDPMELFIRGRELHQYKSKIGNHYFNLFLIYKYYIRSFQKGSPWAKFPPLEIGSKRAPSIDVQDMVR